MLIQQDHSICVLLAEHVFSAQIPTNKKSHWGSCYKILSQIKRNHNFKDECQTLTVANLLSISGPAFSTAVFWIKQQANSQLSWANWAAAWSIISLCCGDAVYWEHKRKEVILQCTVRNAIQSTGHSKYILLIYQPPLTHICNSLTSEMKMLLNILSICGKHTEQWLTVKKQEFLNLIPETHKCDLKTQCVVTTHTK